MNTKLQHLPWVVGIAAGAIVAVMTYTIARLSAAIGPSTPDAVVVASTHIPYYWRCGESLFLGVVTTLLAGLGLRVPQAERALPWITRAAPILVGICVIAMLAVP